MELNMTELGHKLRELRLSQNLTQEQVAMLVGTSKQQISTIELGMRYPNLQQLRRFSSIFHVSTDYLLNLKQDAVLDVSDLTLKQRNAVQTVIDSYRN